MLTLALLRHAKSSWNDPELEDRARPLTKRGVKAAPLMARTLLKVGVKPDLILCSTAVRTRATLALMLAELKGSAPTVAYDDSLYLADPQTILSMLKEVPKETRTVLVVGHNPGLHELALELTGRGERKLVGALAREFPTAALAVLTFEGEDWSEISAASGTLLHFVTPRRLGEG